jgi:hypothetical protein
MDKAEHWVVSTPHVDSPTGYVYVSLLDENTFICTKNISEATVFTSYDRALDFRDEWNLGGLYTIEAMIPIIAKKWDSARLINDGTQPMPILLESEAKQLVQDTQSIIPTPWTYLPPNQWCDNIECFCRANMITEDVWTPRGHPFYHHPKKKSLYERVLSFFRNF